MKNTLAKEAYYPTNKGDANRIFMALLLGSLSAFGPLSIDMYLPSLPILANDFGTTVSIAQLSLTACLLGLALGQLIMGPLSDIYGRRKPLMIGLVIFTIASVLCMLIPSIWSLIAMRLLQGIAGAAGIVISRAIVRDLYAGKELTKFFALLMLVNGVAPIAAPIAGGQLLKYVTWHGVFGVLAIIGLIMYVAVLIGLPETLPKERKSQGGVKSTLLTFKSLIVDKVFIGYSLTQGFVMAAMFAYISGSPFVLQDIFGLSPQGFSIVFAVNGIGIILATQMTGKLVDKVSETKLLTAGLILAIFGSGLMLIMIITEAGLIPVLIPLFIAIASVGIVSTTSFSLAMQSQEKSAGSASALLGLLPFVLGALAAPLVGIAGNDTAVPMGVVMLICHAVAIMSFLYLSRNKKDV
ncbi:Bcr/CflA family multidrug efflux MFS transporter [Bacillus chungangensis]|uniref:Bcr/CflA family efflux transporter n=1 Tax=Bacillus chungangensis TaxID=587633 RepID=A0ABT9WP70_9BACI|nr:Bcr/CflA family multidrug efflux MFS transporter [Bacillus chungangensis]MDQ0174904.1 DHA1 family bicyclomycin/chloramphenicol resistance-like MFS transporter [Bacillus chungangensis]